MMTTQRRSRQPSLRDRILTAQTEAEIRELLAEGSRMTTAQARTRTQWQRAAEKRKIQLGDWRP